MFEFLSTMKTNRSYDVNKFKAVINRLNMGKLYTFSLIGGIGMLLFAMLFSLFKLWLLPASYQTVAFVSFALILFCCALFINILVRSHRTDLFENVCYAYIGVVCVVLLTFAFKSEQNVQSLVFYMCLMLFISTVPLLAPVPYLIAWSANIVMLIILVLVKHMDITTTTSFILISIMGIMLSFLSYAGVMRKLDYKLSLDLAITEAETDPMTGLLNRRGLEHRIANIWPLCIRQQIKAAVIMVDIDNFKKYNDAFGHPAGDECIKAVTGAIRQCIRRRTDYGARVGGEEFLVLLTDIEPAQAIRWTLNLQKSIAALKIPHAENNFTPFVTISAGLATTTVREDTDFEQLRSEADASLYDSKQNGRNRLYYRKKCYRPNRSTEMLLEEAN